LCAGGKGPAFRLLTDPARCPSATRREEQGPVPGAVITGVSFLAGAFAAFAATPVVAAVASRLGIVDRPDARKMHSTPTPRLGGVGVLAGLVVGCVTFDLLRADDAHSWLFSFEERTAVLTAGAIVFAVGLVEDVRGVRPAVRVAAEAGAAAILMLRGGFLIDSVWSPFGPPLSLSWLAYPLTFVWFVGVTNAFNLIDGLDGLLSSVGIASLLGSAAIGLSIGLRGTPLVAISLAGALAGFLPWNWHFGRGLPVRQNGGVGSRARVFLGDSGSLLVGFVAAAASLRAARYVTGGLALHVLVALCAVPVMETLLTMARRYVGDRPLFSPDRSHVHHVLVNVKGLTVPRAVAALAGVQLLCSGTALFTRVRLGWYSLAPSLLLLALAGLGAWWLGYLEFRVLGYHLRQGLFMRRRRHWSQLVRIARAGELVRGANSVTELKARLHEAAQEGRFTYLALEFSEHGERAVSGGRMPPGRLLPVRARAATAGQQQTDDPAEASDLASRELAPVWLFSPPPARSAADRGPGMCNVEDRAADVTYAVQLPAGGRTYGQLVCRRRDDPLGAGPGAGDLQRFLAQPVADALRRLGREEGRGPLTPNNVLEAVET